MISLPSYIPSGASIHISLILYFPACTVSPSYTLVTIVFMSHKLLLLSSLYINIHIINNVIKKNIIDIIKYIAFLLNQNMN